MGRASKLTLSSLALGGPFIMKNALLVTTILVGFGSAATAGSNIYINQYGTTQTAAIEQVGNANNTSVNQYNTGHQAVAKQTGNSNSLNIEQRGNSNVAGKKIDAPWLFAGGEQPSVQQNGNSNVATLTQQGTTNVIGGNWFYQDGNGNRVAVNQNGSNNLVSQFRQVGNGNGSDIAQTGAGNRAMRTQSLGNGNYVGITQRGTNNGIGDAWGSYAAGSIDVTQVTFLDPASSRAGSDVTQIGDRNFSWVDQTGSENGYEVAQGEWSAKSYNSKVDLDQTGTGNYAYAAQTGTSHLSKIMQQGSGHRAFTKQSN